jgi:hypothetical protein
VAGSKKLTYEIGIDAGDAVGSLRTFSGAVKSAMRNVESELDEGATAGEKLARALEEIGQRTKEEFASAATAAEEMSRALKAAGSSLDVADVLPQLQRLGLSFDEITQDADKLAVSLKQLDDVKATGLKDLDATAPGVATKLDEINKSADSSKGALANLIGNSAQDLGELGGVAGSAGVAVGQMAEYFADAAFSGEGLKSVMSSFAAVAGPIALISAVVGTLTTLMGRQQAAAEASAKRTEDFGAAMRDAADDATGIAEVLRENREEMLRFDADAEGFGGGIVEGLAEIGSAIPLLGGLIGEKGRAIGDLAPILDAAGLSMYDFAKAIEEGGLVGKEWTTVLLDALDAGKISEDQYHTLASAISDYGGEVRDAKAIQKLWNVDQKEANALLEETAEPLERMVDLWSVLFADMRDGSIDTQAATDAINGLAEGLGLTQAEVVALADEHLDEELDAQREAAEEAAEAQRDYAIALAEANREMGAITGTFAEMSRRGDALSAIFDLGNAPLDAASATRDIVEGIAGLKDAAKGVKIGDILAGNMDGDAVLDALDGLRPEIQAKISEAFAAGGPQAATDTATWYVEEIYKALDGKLSREQIAELLNLDGLEANIGVALDMSTAERVRAQLAVLTGLRGETPLTASIALALDAGTLSPEAAEVLVRAQLAGAEVALPTDVTPPTPEQIAEAGAFVTASAAKDPAELATTVDPAGAERGVDGFRRDVESDTPAEVPVDADTGDAESTRDDFVDETERTKPIVDIRGETKEAIGLLLALRVFAALLAPRVDITANTAPAMLGIAAVAAQRPRVPVDVYVDDYPSRSEIERMIGRPRIPVDIVVGSSIRITGVRE